VKKLSIKSNNKPLIAVADIVRNSRIANVAIDFPDDFSLFREKSSNPGIVVLLAATL